MEKGRVPRVVEVSERFADGNVKGREFRRVRSQLGAMGGISSRWAANCIEHAVLDDMGHRAATRATDNGSMFFRLLAIEQAHKADPDNWLPDNAPEAVAAFDAERCRQGALIRECFGNLYRSCTASEAWLAWNDGAVRKLAQLMYEGPRLRPPAHPRRRPRRRRLRRRRHPRPLPQRRRTRPRLLGRRSASRQILTSPRAYALAHMGICPICRYPD